MPVTKENRALALMRAAESLANGDLEARVPAAPQGDLGALCETFNRMAEAIAKRERERLDLVAMAAHDLRSPLSVIRSAALLLKEDPSTESTDIWLERIVQNAGEMERIIADFTDEVQMRTGRLELRWTEVDLSKLCRQVLADCEVLLNGHTLRFDGDDTCLIWGDESRLKRLLQNLLSNAAKFSAPGREVCTSLWRRGAKVWLTVEDHGDGIRPSDTERIFRPFQRLDAANSTTVGTGLGLSSVQKIVEAHSGEISVQGSPGRGTTVEIRFKARLRRQN